MEKKNKKKRVQKKKQIAKAIEKELKHLFDTFDIIGRILLDVDPDYLETSGKRINIFEKENKISMGRKIKMNLNY